MAAGEDFPVFDGTVLFFKAGVVAFDFPVFFVWADWVLGVLLFTFVTSFLFFILFLTFPREAGFRFAAVRPFLVSAGLPFAAVRPFLAFLPLALALPVTLTLPFDPVDDLAFFVEVRFETAAFFALVTFLDFDAPFPLGFLVLLGLALDLGFALAAMYDPPDV